MAIWKPIPGETPIDPSGLKDGSIKTRAELNKVEAENVRKAHAKYLAARPSRKLAPFDYSWLCRLHREMFGDVWDWAGETRKREVNLGVAPEQVQPQLFDLTAALRFWEGEANMPLLEQTV